MSDWQLQQAKARFSELVKVAESEGPQYITVHGEPTVVVIALKDYEKLTLPKSSFGEFLAKSPLKGVKLDVNRAKSKTRRDIEL